MIAYNIQNANEVPRQKSPLEPGIWLMPGGCTDVIPPEFNRETHTCKFDGTAWVVELIPEPESELEESSETFPTAMEQLRMMRNSKLAQSDWRMTVDYPYSDQTEWEIYRTELRDIPQKIEAENLPQPTIDENNLLVFENWPEEPGT